MCKSSTYLLMFIFIDRGQWCFAEHNKKITKFENGEFPVIDNLSIVESKIGIDLRVGVIRIEVFLY